MAENYESSQQKAGRCLDTPFALLYAFTPELAHAGFVKR
jgi:hypothetical protein